jgi:hypothetical protein
MFPRPFLFAAREVDQHAQHDEENQKQRHRQGRHQREGFRDAATLRVRLPRKDGHALQRHEARVRADVLGPRAQSRKSRRKIGVASVDDRDALREVGVDPVERGDDLGVFAQPAKSGLVETVRTRL